MKLSRPIFGSNQDLNTRSYRRIGPSLVALIFLLCVQSTHAQKGALDITYTVSLNDVSSQQFHVTTDKDQWRASLQRPFRCVCR